MAAFTHVLEYDGGIFTREIGPSTDSNGFADTLRRFDGVAPWGLTRYATSSGITTTATHRRMCRSHYCAAPRWSAAQKFSTLPTQRSCSSFISRLATSLPSAAFVQSKAGQRGHQRRPSRAPSLAELETVAVAVVLGLAPCQVKTHRESHAGQSGHCPRNLLRCAATAGSIPGSSTEEGRGDAIGAK